MDIKARLRRLEFSYRAALSAAVVANTYYFALAGDPSALSAAVNREKARWQQLDSRKKAVIAEMSELDESEHDLT